MGTTGLGEGHEKTGTGATWQADGLRDSDVLSSATLTNFVERGLGNGVIPLTMTDYSADSGGTDRNNPIVGNCCVRPNTAGATNSIFVDAGTVCLDGAYYTVGSASAFNFDTAGYYNSRFNAGGMQLPAGANQESWVLVIVDPELAGTNNIGLVCGPIVDTSTGVYPQMPSSHLIKQSVVLAAIRVTYASPLVVAAVEDKRVFIRGGPHHLTRLVGADGNPAYPNNNYGTTPSLNAGNLPISKMGHLFARDPAGHHTGTVLGTGQTHLFYQSDAAIGASAGGAYQLTPVHRIEKEVVTYGGPAPHTCAFTPLESTVNPAVHLVTCIFSDALGTATMVLVESIHYTVANKVVTFVAPASPGKIEISYTHAGF